MLYVAIWYVSIRYEGEGRTAVLPWYVSIRYEGEGRTAVLPWYVSIRPVVMRVKEELQFFLGMS